MIDLPDHDHTLPYALLAGAADESSMLQLQSWAGTLGELKLGGSTCLTSPASPASTQKTVVDTNGEKARGHDHALTCIDQGLC